MVGVLKALGIVFLLVIVLLLGAFFFLRQKVRKFFKETFQEMGINSGAPQTIHLNEVEERRWLTQEPVQERLMLLSQHGYEAGPIFEVSEMESLLILALENSSLGTTASLMYHETMGAWFELSAVTQDRIILYSDAQFQVFSEYPDWLEPHYLRENSGAEVVAAFKQRIATETIAPADLATFRQDYEYNYRRLMQWRNEAGGISLEEVRRQNQDSEEPLDEDALQEAYVRVKISEFNAWHLGMLEELEVNPALHPTQDTVFFVPDRAHCEAFVTYLEAFLTLSDRQWEELRAQAQHRRDCGPFFDRLLARLSESLRPTEYCRVTFPLTGRVFMENPIQVNKLEEGDA